MTGSHAYPPAEIEKAVAEAGYELRIASSCA